MEEDDQITNVPGANRGTHPKSAKRVDFRWLVFRRGERAVPIVAVVGREISAQFAFRNLANEPIDELEICVEADRYCEFDICECSEDTFQREVRFESRFGDLFRTKASCHRIVYHGGVIDGQQEVPGWLRMRVKKLEGPTYSLPSVPVDFLSVALTLRAYYKFRSKEARGSARLRAEEVTFVKKRNIPERIVRKLKEEWLEFIVVSIFAWIVGLFSPSLFRALKALLETAVGLFR